MGADGKKIRDPEELRKEAERLRKEHEAIAAEERRKKQAQQAIIQAQVARIRKQIQDDVNEKEKQKKERMFHDNRFVFSMREKIKEEETWKSMDQSEEDRRVKYKYSLFRAKELEYEAHKKKYADEGREALVARVEKKERARASASSVCFVCPPTSAGQRECADSRVVRYGTHGWMDVTKKNVSHCPDSSVHFACDLFLAQ